LVIPHRASALLQGQRVQIQRLHLEHDSAKSLHTAEGATLLDFNRAGWLL
jgi:Asp-tRNA(Asn)/Glu-tRNA(Gln) amidotransferase B subunit